MPLKGRKVSWTSGWVSNRLQAHTRNRHFRLISLFERMRGHIHNKWRASKYLDSLSTYKHKALAFGQTKPNRRVVRILKCSKLHNSSPWCVYFEFIELTFFMKLVQFFFFFLCRQGAHTIYRGTIFHSMKWDLESYIWKLEPESNFNQSRISTDILINMCNVCHILWEIFSHFHF
jgi:hypothetical protein